MSYIPPLAQTLAAATQAQRVAKARNVAKKIILLLASLPVIHGDYPREALTQQDWGQAIEIEQCALWVLECNPRWLTLEELAIEWLCHKRLAEHGAWPEVIPYPVGALARVGQMEAMI